MQEIFILLFGYSVYAIGDVLRLYVLRLMMSNYL